MCQFKSAIVTRDGQMLHHPMTDSHTDLIAYFGLKEGRAGQNFVRVEFTPSVKDGQPDYLAVDNYQLKVDEESTPAWFDDDRREGIINFLSGIVRNMIVKGGEKAIILDGAWILAGDTQVGIAQCCRVISLCGNATISDVRDNAKISYVGDNAKIGYVGDNATISDVRDNAKISYVGGNATISDVGGNATISDVRDNAKISYVGDNAKIGYVRDNAKIEKDRRPK